MRGVVLAALAACGCGGSEPFSGGDAQAPDGTPALDARADAEPGSDGSTNPCPRLPRPADGPRKAVLSHPFGPGGQPSGDYELIAVGADGALTFPGTHFAMRRATQGRIRFTPDGEVGLLAQDDGSIGAFRIDPSGSVRVVHEAFRGAFYASSIVMDPEGSKAYVLDAEWRESGGGIYRIAIACDGTLSDLGLWAPAKLPYGMVIVPGRSDRAAVTATDILQSTPGHDAFVVARAAAPSIVGSSDVFTDDQQIVSDVAMTPDGRFFLIADNSEFSGLPNRVAAVEVGAEPVRAAQMLSPIRDPVALIASPLGDAVLVASGYGNALLVLSYHPESATPFALAGPVAYRGARPELPGSAVLIDRGPLAGRVLVAETAGLRQLQFRGGGMVEDLGVVSTGSGSTSLVGALGVQP